MNILPKKRWHVRNKDNVARVRRDEQKAKEEAEEAERRRDFAEKEAKLEILRKKSAKEVTTASLQGEDGTKSCLNLFKDFQEESKTVVKANKEYEREKKEKQEAFEKKIGILTYLGQSVSKDESPWYLQKEKVSKDDSKESLDRIDERRKMKMDPMQDVERYFKAKSKHKEKSKKSKNKYKEVIEASPVSPKNSSIEVLRAKRLAREKEERAKTEQLLKEKSGKSVKPSDNGYDPSRYSSQYNPDLARKSNSSGRFRPY